MVRQDTTGPSGPLAHRDPKTRADQPRLALVEAVLGGLLVAVAMPPIALWPASILGVALWDDAIRGFGPRRRFGMSWLFGFFWMAPATLFLADLTLPGYVVAAAMAATFLAIAGALTPAHRYRMVVLPAAVVVMEFVRWSWPFGGVPLGHLALAHTGSGLAWSARIGGSLLVVAMVVLLGQSLARLLRRQYRVALISLSVVVVVTMAGAWHPRAEVLDEIDVALVQGGGAQRTRASARQQPIVLARHVEASRLIDQPVDLIVWPENVVNPGSRLSQDDAHRLVTMVAADNDAPVLAGWFHRVTEDGETVGTANYQSTIMPDGTEIGRYNKVILVPFGEFVPLRSLIELVSDEIPSTDVIDSDDTPVLETKYGPIGVSISWEGFFESRARAATAAGAVLLTNPTNGASYWLNQVQTQQVASNRLRAIENDRWVLQVAPTGLSAVINPEGRVVQRSEISDRATLVETVELRSGRTLASLLGPWPIVLAAVVVIGLAHHHNRRLTAPIDQRPPGH